jgi:tetratricopeptide (TPR) repeat protein
MKNPSLTYAQRHYDSAIEHFENEVFDKAIQQINMAIQNAPINPDMYATKGIFLQKMNDLENAEKAYLEALQIYDEHSYANYNLGILKMHSGQPLEAIKYWKVLIESTPDDIDALFNIGVALTTINQRKEAINFFNHILELKPEHVLSHQNLAVIYREHSEFDNARYHFNKLKELDSTFAEAAEIEIKKCNELEAKEKERLNETINLGFSNLSDLMIDDSQYSTALFAIVEGRFDDALETADEMLKLNPDDSQAFMIKGQALRGQGKSHAAIAILTHMLSKNEKSTEAMYSLGEIFQEMGQLEKALEYFERLIEYDPEHNIALQNIKDIKDKLPHR